MKPVQHIAYRFLTDADFFNIYKPLGAEEGGGGQKYIDFPVSDISLEQWEDFLADIENLERGMLTHGPKWKFPIYSIGIDVTDQQTLEMYQRRAPTVSISRQHIHTGGANRVLAWHPDHGFPANSEYPAPMPIKQGVPHGLAIFLVKTYDNEIWAGWFMNGSQQPPTQNEAAKKLLAEILDPNNEEGDAGFLSFEKGILRLVESNSEQPFTTEMATTNVKPVRSPRTYSKKQKTEEELTVSLFSEDEEEDATTNTETKMVIVKTRVRNKKSVNALKELYGHVCQITGNEFLFKKRDGVPYTEAHHLIPLGKGGADSPRNMIIIDPRVHRMLHYAEVEGINLSNIQEKEDGSATLAIKINGDPYTITWHPKHIEYVKKFEES
ncbi:MAG TPA: HNH endonuclease [Candidatus Peribacterales bacterium]|nr:HNH endonuclease [Candidatus Peribacterales bacterium]